MNSSLSDRLAFRWHNAKWNGYNTFAFNETQLSWELFIVPYTICSCNEGRLHLSLYDCCVLVCVLFFIIIILLAYCRKCAKRTTILLCCVHFTCAPRRSLFACDLNRELWDSHPQVDREDLNQGRVVPLQTGRWSDARVRWHLCARCESHIYLYISCLWHPRNLIAFKGFLSLFLSLHTPSKTCSKMLPT